MLKEIRLTCIFSSQVVWSQHQVNRRKIHPSTRCAAAERRLEQFRQNERRLKATQEEMRVLWTLGCQSRLARLQCLLRTGHRSPITADRASAVPKRDWYRLVTSTAVGTNQTSHHGEFWLHFPRVLCIWPNENGAQKRFPPTRQESKVLSLICCIYVLHILVF